MHPSRLKRVDKISSNVLGVLVTTTFQQNCLYDEQSNVWTTHVKTGQNAVAPLRAQSVHDDFVGLLRSQVLVLFAGRLGRHFTRDTRNLVEQISKKLDRAEVDMR